MKQIRTSESVLFYDTDCGGVVSNIAYLRYVERARCELFSRLGMPLANMENEALFPTVTRTEIDYFRPGRLGDELITSARIADVGKVKMECEFEIFRIEREEAKTLLARARQVVAVLQMPSGRPRRLPEDWKKMTF